MFLRLRMALLVRLSLMGLVVAGGLGGAEISLAAQQPEPPALLSVDVEPTAWSGWWWPAFNGVGPTLFASSGPLAKYDEYVRRLTGQDPGTRSWERQQVFYPNFPWAGHCNGFAAAALLEPEPIRPTSALGVEFSVGDLKGLLVDYHFGDSAAWSFGDADADLTPYDFHRMLLEWIAASGTGFVVSFDNGGGEVWSYPVTGFSSQWQPDPVEDDLWHVTTTVRMADMQVPPNFVGTRPYPGPDGQVFTYDLRGDPRHPDDGWWAGSSETGHFAHPSRIWYPDAQRRNADPNLVSPGLDRDLLATLIASAVADD